MLTLVEPSEDLAKLYVDMCEDFSSHAEPWYPYRTLEDARKRIRMELGWAGGIVPEGAVLSIPFWFLDEHKVLVGTSRLRPNLNERFLKKGGHIGYDVRPSYRRMGYATEILRLTLRAARAVGLPRVLITCDDSNIGSFRAIEKNGGLMEGLTADSENNTMIRRYWIKLG